MSLAGRLAHFIRVYLLHLETTPEERKSFAEQVARNGAEAFESYSVVIGLTVLALWPTDRFVLATRPDLVEAFSVWRPLIVGACTFAWLVLRFVPSVRRFPLAFLVALNTPIFFFSCALFVPKGGLSEPTSFLAYDFLFMLVPMPATFPARLASTLVLQLALVAGGLSAGPHLMSDPYFVYWVSVGFLVSLANVFFGHLVFHLSYLNFRQQQALSRESEKAERLLLNVLPAPIAARLKERPDAIAERLEEVTVLFADISGFTPMSEGLSPERLVELLNGIFSAFDSLVAERGLEKIKTIGDAYMVAGGLPTPRGDHAEAVADLALAMQQVARGFATPDGTPVTLRIGLHVGPVVAGVIGSRKFSYDLWGDTVNTASRMESHGVAGEVTLSPTAHAKLSPRFETTSRGVHKVKGKGEMELFLLGGRRA